MRRVRAIIRPVAHPRRGQAMIETAFILPIFLLVVFGLFDLGRIVFLKVELENAVREGARLGMVTRDFAAVRQRVTSQPGLAGATVNPSCSNPNPCDYGSLLTVEATLQTPLVAGVLSVQSLTLTASASVRIE